MKIELPAGSLALGVLGFLAGALARPQGEALTRDQREVLAHVRWLEVPDGQGGTIGTVVFEGVNVQVVNGQGQTDSADGSGNLIVGYNETGCRYGDTRSGSHNLVVGQHNNYSSYGGAVIGHGNASSAPWASVTGGEYGRAKGFASCVSGGLENEAEGVHSSVSGGKFNRAAGRFSAVTGGHLNVASGYSSSITAGFNNLASGFQSTVSGGVLNKACGETTAVSGGVQCIVNGSHDWGAGTVIKDF